MVSTQVLFIVGSGRSGSTLLANVLGGVDGCTSVGELRFLWARGVLQNRRCGCGLAFDACPFWQAVMERAGGGDPLDAGQTATQLERLTRMRQLPRYLRPVRAAARLPQLSDTLARTYRAVAEVAGARIVVDSSKLPTYALLVGSLPGVEVTYVHLLRDPRAVAYSWQRVKELTDVGPEATMQQLTPLKSSGLWDVWNASAYALGRRRRYLRLRYEDFVAAPRRAVEQILHFAGVDSAAMPFTADGLARLDVTHTVAGNPNRMTSGPVAIRSDDEWKDHLDPWQRRIVTAATAPLLAGFGYPLMSARNSR